MIQSFTPQFRLWSFQRFDRCSYFREQQHLRWLIYETPLSKRDPQVRLNLGIGIIDPFLDNERTQLVCLRGDVEPAGITVHFDESPHWWKENEGETVRAIICDCALDWFNYWSETQLIRYFEQPSANVTCRYPRAAMPRIDDTPVTRKPPIHQRWLALLYYHQKDYQHSLAYAKEWFEKVKHLATDQSDPEPERTLRQIAALNDSLKK